MISYLAIDLSLMNFVNLKIDSSVEINNSAHAGFRYSIEFRFLRFNWLCVADGGLAYAGFTIDCSSLVYFKGWRRLLCGQ